MILIINISKEKLHYLEFVKPIEDILGKEKIEFQTKYYQKIVDKDLKADKIIICGTSLKDNTFLENQDYFNWLKVYKKPVLGICGGMQVIALFFKSELIEDKQIGQIEINLKKEFLGLRGKTKIYSLHNNSIIANPEKFESFASSSSNILCSEAIKHKTLSFYGVLFHPEVFNKEMIAKFCEL